MIISSRRAFLGTAAAAAIAPIGGAVTFEEQRGRGGAPASQPAADPLFAELTAQLSAAVSGLAAVPPKGNAQQLAGLYRMVGAWAKANAIDAALKERVERAIARDGHHTLVSRAVAVDRLAERKRRRIPVTPLTRNRTWEEVAKGVGMLRAGAGVEMAAPKAARAIERNAARFNRQMAILNGQPEDSATMRLIQHGGEGGFDPEPDPNCEQLPDGSFSCVLQSDPTPTDTAPNGMPWPTDRWCSNFEMSLNLWDLLFMVGAFLQPELALMYLLAGGGIELIEWYNGC